MTERKNIREVLREARRRRGAPHLRERVAALVKDQPSGVSRHLLRAYGVRDIEPHERLNKENI